jgi:hypothetical protein
MTLGSAYAKGKWALGECRRSGRKMLLRNMVADGYYPNLIVDPEWYEPKHPQESLPKVRDPVSLFRPAPDQDKSSAIIRFDCDKRRFTGFTLGNVALNIIGPGAAKDASFYLLKSDDPTPENFSTPGGDRFDVVWRPDGTRAWTHWSVSFGGDDTHQYDVSPAWSTTGWTPSGGILRSTGSNRSMTWHDNGDKLTFCSVFFSSFRRLDTFDMSATPYDISGGLGPLFASFTGLISSEYLARFSLDESSIFVSRISTELRRYNMSTPGDISTITGFDQLYLGAAVGFSNTWGFSADHTKIYFQTSLGTLLASIDLTAPDDISAPFNFSTGVSTDIPTNLQVARGLTIRPDTGDLILLADQNNQRIRCWNP